MPFYHCNERHPFQKLDYRPHMSFSCKRWGQSWPLHIEQPMYTVIMIWAIILFEGLLLVVVIDLR